MPANVLTGTGWMLICLQKSSSAQGSAPRRFYRTVYRRRKERFYRTDYRGQNSGFSIPRFLKTATFSKMLTAKTALFQNSYRYRYRLPPLPKILTAKPHRQKFQYRYRYRYRESGFTAGGFSVKPPRCRPLVGTRFGPPVLNTFIYFLTFYT